MPTISGSVLYNINNQSPTTGNGIPNIPVALYNTSTNLGIIVLTDASGNYTISNVPAGNYTVVEAYGTLGVTSPANFSLATVLGTVIPSDPIISAVPSVSPIATNIQSLSPNTLFITIATSNLTGINFIDGPVKNVPILYSSYVTPSPINLITAANNGNMGTLPSGSPLRSFAPSAPYPTVTTGFTYVSGDPYDGSYSISNIYTHAPGVWWMTADHTSRDETGRMMLVGGSTPGATLFTQTISVIPNTSYLLSVWILNLINTSGYAAPQVRFEALDQSNNIIYNQTSSNILVDSIPTWYELGTIFNSGNNSTITIKLYSNGPAASGNDFVVDDFSLNQIIPNNILTIDKSVSNNYIALNNQITYTFKITNTSTTTITNFIFSDTLPTGSSFINNSLSLNNSIVNGNPTPPGINLGTINPSTTNTIRFSVLAYTTPLGNYLINQGISNYAFNALNNGTTVTNMVLSNTVSTFVATNNVSITKYAFPYFLTCGNTISYTITIQNNGNVTAKNTFFIDTLPNSITFIPNTLFLNNSLVTGASLTIGFSLGNINPSDNITLTYQCIINL